MGILSSIFNPPENSDSGNSSKVVNDKNVTNRNRNACPHCGFILDPPPKRKKKCEECGNHIYIRKTQEIFNSDLLREDQALAADFFKDLMQSGAKPTDYTAMREELKSEWGFDPNPYDIVWSVSRQLITKGPDLTGVYDPKGEILQHAKMITFAQALYQAKRGEDTAYLKRIIADYEIDINSIRGADITRMEVLSNGCCDNCEKFNGRKYEINGLKEKQILPIENCTNKLQKDDNFSWCVCMFLPVID